MLFFGLIFYSAILSILTYYSHNTADYLKKMSECFIIKQTSTLKLSSELFSKSVLLVLSLRELPLGPGADKDSVDDAIFRAGLHCTS